MSCSRGSPLVQTKPVGYLEKESLQTISSAVSLSSPHFDQESVLMWKPEVIPQPHLKSAESRGCIMHIILATLVYFSEVTASPMCRPGRRLKLALSFATV